MDKLRIMFSGGGTRCAYQLAFCQYLFKNKKFNEKYNIDRLYGTSFGALVSFFICCDRYDLLNNFFLTLNEKGLKKWFDLWGYEDYIIKIPILGKIIGVIINFIWLIKGIKNKGLYDPNLGSSFLQQVNINYKLKNKLIKYYCCVYNITRGKSMYINGTHPLIKDYIIASSSLWIVFPPKVIPQYKFECDCNEFCNCFIDKKENPNNLCNCKNILHRQNEFLDGGVFDPIPFHFDEDYDGNYLVLTTKNIQDTINQKNPFNYSGNHLFDYLDNIICLLIDRNQYYKFKYDHKEWKDSKRVKIINYAPINNDPTLMDKDTIKKYMEDGKYLFKNFVDDIE